MTEGMVLSDTGEAGRGEPRVKDWVLSAAWEATGCFIHRSDTTKCTHSFRIYSTHRVGLEGCKAW